MKWRSRSEAGIAQVEKTILRVLVQVRVEAEQAGQAHHEDQVEIGKATLAGIQPEQAVFYVVEKPAVGLFLACGMKMNSAMKSIMESLRASVPTVAYAVAMRASFKRCKC